MPSTGIDRIDGNTTSVAVKAPCRVVSTTPITLYGTPVISGVQLQYGGGSTLPDRVLVNGQTDQTTNGIYIVQEFAWIRAYDFDGARDAVTGTLVPVLGNSAFPDSIWRVTTTDNPIIFGAAPAEGSLITFQETSFSEGSLINYGFTNFIISPQTPPTFSTSSFSVTLPAVQAVVNGVIVNYPAVNLTMPANTITDYWGNPYGSPSSFTIDSQPATNYVALNRYPTLLPIWKIQSSATGIANVYLMGNRAPYTNIETDNTHVVAQIPELYGIAIDTTPTAWSSGGTALFREVIYTTDGNLYQVFVSGTLGTSKPTGTGYNASTGVYGPITNGGVTLYYYGQYNFIGNIRYGINNHIENYFSNIGVKTFTCLTDANGVAMAPYAKAYWQNQMQNLILNRVNSGTYLFGMKCIAGGYIWLNTTFGTAGSGGTAAGSSPFSGSYTVNTTNSPYNGSTVTDGTITWLCIGISYSSQNAFWMDTDQTQTIYVAPDSHDSYASTFFDGLYEYIKYTNDWQWLLTASPQPSGSSTYNTWLAVLQAIFDNNLATISNFLTPTFQSNINPKDGSSYTIQFYEDNCESYSGELAAASIFALGNMDYTRSVNAVGYAADVNSGVYNLFNTTYNVFDEYYGDNPANWPITNPELGFYPYYQMQFFAELHQVSNINDDTKQFVRQFVMDNWNNFYTDSSKDVTPALFIGFIAAVYWQDIPKATACLEIAERYFIGNSSINIQDFAYYLRIKNALVNNCNIAKINGPKITFRNTQDTPYTLNATQTFASSGNYPASLLDYQIGINKSSLTAGATEVILPATPPDGWPYIIKDEKGDSSTNNITIVGTPSSTVQIDGSSVLVINSGYGYARVRWKTAAGKWFTE